MTDKTTEKIAHSATWAAIARIGSIIGGLVAPLALTALTFAASSLVELKTQQAAQAADIKSIDDKMDDMKADIRRLEDWVKDISSGARKP